jgi:large conductance mechanosensitive channel
MIREFKEFLLKQNAVALAIGVIIGAAIGKLVTSLADNVLNPIIGLLLPSGGWRTAAIVLRQHVDPKTGQVVIDNAIGYGALLGAFVDFLIVGLVVFDVTKSLLPRVSHAPLTKECPQCRDVIPIAATRCKSCTQPVP